ncbi:hypothetical protein BECP10_00010 [Escherichia phage vB_EcoS-BECP10]|uniref:Uncharacterized protein n=1 Tax=Escherichia phage vB_EcoS-BECP10 TaxID=2797407 RepID=A0A7T7GTY0_9CAUD|nr:hypothetical protein BECP10_00010 [Escherichia phage vB_EcoS-BECP10]
MTTTLTKNFISNNNVLYKARVKDGLEQIKKNGKWINLEERGKYIKTKTLLCTKVDHSNPLKKSFTEGKRYQISMHAGLGRNAGYIYDNEGDGWQLTRDDEVGYDVGFGMYKFEAQYK